MGLTVGEVAEVLGTATARIERLVEAGLLTPADDGRYAAGDVHRVRLFLAFEDAGVPLEAVARSIEHGAAGLEFVDRFYPNPEPAPGRTYGDVVADLPSDPSATAELYSTMGLAEPDPGTHVPSGEDQVLFALSELSERFEDRTLLLRAAHAYGRAARQAAQVIVGLYAEYEAPLADELDRLSGDEAFERLLAPWAALSQLSPRLLGWLHARHLEDAIDAFIVEHAERHLAELGYVAPRDEQPPAMAFADLSGFTRVSYERGDEFSAELATKLAATADAVAREHQGSVVKSLGDGVMMHFPTADEAVPASLDLVDRAGQGELLPVHVGIQAGPVVYRDGDYFGSTVNSAARISDVATEGQVLLGRTTAELLSDVDVALEPVGVYELQGFDQPVELLRALRRT